MQLFSGTFCCCCCSVLGILLALEFGNDSLQLSFSFTLWEITHIVVLWSDLYKPETEERTVCQSIILSGTTVQVGRHFSVTVQCVIFGDLEEHSDIKWLYFRQQHLPLSSYYVQWSTHSNLDSLSIFLRETKLCLFHCDYTIVFMSIQAAYWSFANIKVMNETKYYTLDRHQTVQANRQQTTHHSGLMSVQVRM